MLHRAPQSILVMSAEPKRQMRFLNRLGLHADVFEVPKLPVKTRLRLRPKQLHDLERFGEPGHASFTRITKNLLVRAEMTTAEADAHDRAPAAHDVQGGVSLGELQRIAQRQQNDRSSQFYFGCDRRHVTKQCHWFEHGEIADDPFLQPQAVVTERLRSHRKLPDMLHVGRTLEKNLRELNTTACVLAGHQNWLSFSRFLTLASG